MTSKISAGVDMILEHYVLVIMLLALAALTMGGVGSPDAVGITGLVLCAAGLSQREAKADLWVLGPLAAYLLLGGVSSYITYGHFAGGYTATQSVLPVLYLLMACLDGRDLLLFRRLSVLWAGYVAAHGLAQFLRKALDGTAGRLGGMLGNPNPLGIFLVLAWFGLTAWMPGENEKGLLPALLRRLEPLLLTALALTLSMGSFVALAAGMAYMAAGWLRREGWRAALPRTCRMLAKAGLCVGLGILMYFTARHTGIPWFCLVLLAYLLALMALWERLDRFLRDLPWAAGTMTAFGGLVAAAAVAIRPSSIATFAERLEMMRNGLGYILASPLLGVGPYQWRLLNLRDADTYFNTWHIHNIPIHIAVELGLPAAAALMVIVVHAFRKKGPNRAGFTALVCHCLMDTGFFYLGTMSLMTATVGEPERGGTRLSTAAVRALFLLAGAHFAYCVYAARVLT